jgi:hypothetical protein
MAEGYRWGFLGFNTIELDLFTLFTNKNGDLTNKHG